VVKVLFVPELKVNMLSISALEDMGYAVMFEDGQVLILSKGATLDAAVRLGIREGMMYKVMGQHVVESKGILDHRSVSETESSGRVASHKTAKPVNWYDMTLMDEESRLSDQSATEIAGESSSSEGAATAADVMGSEIDPGGDTFLAKREC
jgi:alkyl hydroperoxide reductase subunit AhpF